MHELSYTINDSNFTSRLKQGDKELFEIIFNDYYGKLCNYAESLLGDMSEAEDIVSDFFVYFWENREKLEITTSLSSYLFASVRNRSFNYIKRLTVKDKYKTIIHMHYQGDSPFDKSGNSSKFDFDALQLKIDEVINNLPNQCRKVFLLNRYEEKKYEEIATELNISRSAVKKHIVKALDHMRRNLRDAEFID